MKKRVTSMSMKEFLLRLVRRIGPADRAAQSLLRKRLGRRGGTAKLNRAYRKLKGDEPAMFQALFAKACTENEPEIEDTVWEIEFAGKQLQLPLRNGKLWLDWDNAVSIIGHDPEVKRTYENILQSEYRPSVFFDVGANYGIHSLLFLAHGVHVISFEPNPECGREFSNSCELNGFTPHLIQAAVSDLSGESDFWFPLRFTWLGSIVESTRETLISAAHDVEAIRVKIITLDDFVNSSGIVPDLIKIDTEGNEINVLRGASRTIRSARPLTIFEANELNNRNEIWSVFEELEYSLFTLPFAFGLGSILDKTDFADAQENNFIALPREHRSLS